MGQPIEPSERTRVEHDAIHEAARLMVRYGETETPRRLLAAHVADDRGRCRGCQGQVRSTKWPCALVAIARAALRIAADRR